MSFKVVSVNVRVYVFTLHHSVLWPGENVASTPKGPLTLTMQSFTSNNLSRTHFADVVCHKHYNVFFFFTF